MTIGECLDVIRRTDLAGNVDLMSKIGLQLLRDIKYKHFLKQGDYPRNGWTLYYSNQKPVLYHSGLRIPVSLTEQVASTPKETNRERILESKLALYRNYKKES